MSLLNVNKIAPQSGTAFTLGDSGDTFTVPSGATLTVAGTFTQTGAQTFDGGVDIDNFNINGTTIALTSGNMTIDAQGNDTDIIFKGTDGSADTTFLTIDGSAAGAATFNNNVTVGDNLNMTTDSSVINFGADSDTTLTHTDGTGLTLNSTNKLCFNDASQFIQGTSATVLSIGATDEIDLTATAVDLNGTLDVSGTLTVAGTTTLAATSFGDNAITNVSTLGCDKIFGDADTDTFIEFAGSNVMNFSAGGGDVALRIDANKDVLLFGPGDLHLYDDKGITFGDGNDWHIGPGDAESYFRIAKDSDVASGLEEGVSIYGTGASGAYQFMVIGGETKSPGLFLYQDQGDDNADKWIIGQHAGNGDANTSIFFTQYSGGGWDNEMKLTQAGVLSVEGAVNASTNVDYAEYFEWKTELANDAKITETYGLTVVLDGDKIRLAETGEEAKVLGVVRPNNTSSIVGGSHDLKYKDKYEKNVWGEVQYEEYTLATWVEKDEDGKITKKHSYHKDRIPAKKIKENTDLDQTEPNWHTLASNLTSEDLVVPSTDAEKSAAQYTERTTYKNDKGDHKKDDKLTRKKVNSSYDSSKSYVSREDRRKEWCIVGLLGQVQVRDTAIVPTSWTKMKNLETGIDLYYIK